jgi:hypothetical protein
MCTLVIASSLVLASCGTNDPDDPPSDPGTGSGDGGGSSDQWGALSIDRGGFVVDGTRWWTPTTAPTLRGLFVAKGAVTIEVNITGAASVEAKIDGTMWSAKLPAGSIGASGTEVTVVMTNAGGEHISLMQTLVLDTRAPAIALLPSLVDDERYDEIDFSTGEPVHTHTWPEISLGESDCTPVYKHAYLTGASDPPFGTQKTRNPIRYNFWIDETQLDASFTAYRVRTPENAVLRDWTAIAAYGWWYTIWLVNDGSHGVPELQRRAGKYFVDVRARDWSGLESTATWCFDLRLLAAPLQIEAVEPASEPSAGMPPLLSMSMSAKSPMSLLAGDAIGPAIASQRIVQYTAEPIVLTYQLAPAAIRFARTYVDGYVPVVKTPLSHTTCEQIDCDLPPLPDPADSTSSGPLTEHRWRMVLLDETTNEIVPPLSTGVAVIPPRAQHEPPRAYRLVAHLGELDDLRPSPGLLPGEHSLAGFTYTGLPPVDEQTRCTATLEQCGLGACVTLCTEATTSKRVIALGHVALELDGLSFELATSVTPPDESHPPWAPARSFPIDALTWDSGDADLPGVH